MKNMFPVLKREGMRSIIFYHIAGWGHGGLHNYLMGKLMWNADADVETVITDYLLHAYGKEAGEKMRALYAKLEKWVSDYKRGNVNDFSWLLHTPMAEAIWAKNYREIETDYSAALNLTKTPQQKTRLEYFGLCLKVLNYHLRKAEMLPDAGKTLCYLSDTQFEDFAKQNYLTLAVETDRNAKDHREFLRPRLWRSETREAVVPRLRENAPAIDGDLSDDAWKSAVLLNDFRVLNSHDSARENTNVRMMFDENKLYLAFFCEEADSASIRDSVPGNARDDGKIYDNDCVEFFLGPQQDAGDTAVGVVKHNYWHITVNPSGAVWDDYCREIGENIKATVKTKRVEKGWAVEMAIDMESLNLDKLAGRRLTGNFSREQPRNGQGESENSCWNASERGFCDPNMFGVFEFVQ